MYVIEGSIKGVTPINFNKKIPNPKKKPTEEEMIEMCSQKVHRGSNGNIVIPEDMFKGAMLEGCSLAALKNGRKSLYPYLKGAVAVEGALDLGKQTWDRILPTEIIKKGASGRGEMIWTCYPQVDTGWTANFRLLVGDDSLDWEKIKIAIEYAGLFVGMGAWRSKFGKFTLESFKKIAVK